MSTPNIWLNRKQISLTDVLQPTMNGRTPWYLNSCKSKKHKQTFLIGVAGGTASGKTSVCREIVEKLHLPWVQILSLDCFYRPLTEEEHLNVHNYNFDHPNAFDWDLLLNVLKELKKGKAVKCPQYDFTKHRRHKESLLMYGADVVLCEGILMLHNADIIKEFDVKAFVKTDDDIRLIRRIKRDMKSRGRTLESILFQYEKTVKPSYDLFCEPTQSVADIVIPRGRENIVAIDLLCDHIKNKLIESGNINPIFYNIEKHNRINSDFIPRNVMIPPNDDNIDKIQNAVDSLHDDEALLSKHKLLQNISLLCNALFTLCIEVFIPRRFCTPSPEPKDIDVNQDDSSSNESNSPEIMLFDDEKGCIQNICIVTIFSGGMIFGETIMDQIGNNKLYKVNFGSIHIFHESKKAAKPRFYDRKLPYDIHKQKVVMVDAFIGTGNRARMALQVLIDHHVPEQNICLISLISDQHGIVKLAKVFPNVQFITAKLDRTGDHPHWETVPVMSSLVVKYCEAKGIEVVDDESESVPCLY